ncbi:MAG: PIN domain-containing protein, partial [Terriglobales bacterium]
VGLRFSYQLLRRHFARPEAHRCFLGVMLSRRVQGLIPDTATAEPGTAVQYRIELGGELRWSIIEDESDAKSELDEIAPSSALARQLLGKGIDDSFQIGIYQHATIVAIQSKYVFRFQQSLTGWESRFSDDSSIVTMPAVDQSGKPDLSNLLASLDRRAEHVQEMETLYRTQPMPIAMFWHALGRPGAFEAQLYLASRDKMPVRSCSGDAPERARALADYASAGVIVADVSALATIRIIGVQALDRLRSKEILVVDSAIEEVEEPLHEESRGRVAGHLERRDGSYVLAEEAEGDQETRQDDLRAFVAAIRRRCRVVEGTALAAFSSEQRDKMKRTLGLPTAAAIAMAAKVGAILWTDDFVVAALAIAEHGVKRIWTQLMLQAELAAGTLDHDTCLSGELTLLASGYTFTSMHPALIVHAGRATGWNPGKAQLAAVLMQIANPTIDIRQLLQLAGAFVMFLYKDAALPATRESAIVALLEQLAHHPNGASGIRVLEQVVPRLFPLDPIRGAEALGIVATWRQARGDLAI